MLRLLFVVLLAASPFVAALPGPVEEAPTDGDCDDSGLLVCVLAGAGAAVACGENRAVVTCSWTRGFGWQGFSRVGLPGEIHGTSAAQWKVCVDQVCTVTPFAEEAFTCSWTGPLSCTGGAGPNPGSVGPVALSLGQCIVVTVDVTVTASGSVPNGSPVGTVASAAFSDASQGAGAACHLNDGRD